MIESIPWLQSATLLGITEINLEEISGGGTRRESFQDRKQWRELLVAALIFRVKISEGKQFSSVG
jgi:hypothetical protein